MYSHASATDGIHRAGRILFGIPAARGARHFPQKNGGNKENAKKSHRKMEAAVCHSPSNQFCHIVHPLKVCGSSPLKTDLPPGEVFWKGGADLSLPFGDPRKFGFHFIPANCDRKADSTNRTTSCRCSGYPETSMLTGWSVQGLDGFPGGILTGCGWGMDPP